MGTHKHVYKLKCISTHRLHLNSQDLLSQSQLQSYSTPVYHKTPSLPLHITVMHNMMKS